MESSIETSAPLSWHSKKFDGKHGEVFHLTSPSNFSLELVGARNLIILLVQLAERKSEIVLPDSSRITNHNGDLIVIDTEPWLNEGFNSGDYIGDAGDLARCIARLLLEKE